MYMYVFMYMYIYFPDLLILSDTARMSMEGLAVIPSLKKISLLSSASMDPQGECESWSPFLSIMECY